MEEARKYRFALAMAVDRDQLLKDAQGGFGWARYTRMDIHPGNPLFKDEWIIPYDLDLAKQYIAESRTGECGSFTMHIANDRAMDFDVGQAIGQFWRALGCEGPVRPDRIPTARPKLVNREKADPWMQTIGRGFLPDARVCCGWPSAGYNEGLEWTDEIIAKHSQTGSGEHNVRATSPDQHRDSGLVHQVDVGVALHGPADDCGHQAGSGLMGAVRHNGPLVNNLASVVMK